MRFPYCTGMLLLALGAALLWAMCRFYIADADISGFAAAWPLFSLAVAAWLCGGLPAERYLTVSLKTGAALWLSIFALVWWFYPWPLPAGLTALSAAAVLAGFPVISFLSFCYRQAKGQLHNQEPPQN
ncbi:MAG: hypothetical protein K6B40_08035 [Firmicutes bacterium]|nr:hypothetical protein [Bacillota bacterium]